MGFNPRGKREGSVCHTHGGADDHRSADRDIHGNAASNADAYRVADTHASTYGDPGAQAWASAYQAARPAGGGAIVFVCQQEDSPNATS